jgi:hypothetical protein
VDLAVEAVPRAAADGEFGSRCLRGPEPADPPASGRAVRRTPWWRTSTSLWLTFIVVSLSPLVVGMVSRIMSIGPGDMSGDRALIALAVRRAWSEPVLLGPYSRFFWHHPGPLYFDLLAVPNWLFGGRTIGLVLGVTAINVAAAVGIVVLTVRRGGWALGAWTSLLLGVYLGALGPAVFDIWNPSATLLPLALVLTLGWSVACLDLWAMPWLVLTASFCIQTHVGHLPAVLAACIASAVTLRVRHGRGELATSEARRDVRRALLTSGFLGVVLWLPPFVEQLTAGHGNLLALVRFFAASGTNHSVSDGIAQTAFQVTLLPRGLFAGGVLTDLQVHTTFALELVLSVVAFGGALALAWKARASALLFLVGLVVVELAVAVYSVTRIVGPVEYYLVEWISAIGLMVWIALGGGVIEVVRQTAALRHGMLRKSAAVVAMCAAAGIAMQGATNVVVTRNAYADRGEQRIVASILATTRHAPRVVLRLASMAAWPPLAGAAFELEQRGVEVEIVRSEVTELLFERSELVRRPTGQLMVAFRDRREGTKASGPVIMRAGRWQIERDVER